MKIMKTTNSLSNNSLKRIKKKSNPYVSFSNDNIKEIEITLTNKCNLSCLGCGFNVPHQVSPVVGKGIEQHLESLKILKKIGLKINKIVLVGGEATLLKNLGDYIKRIKEIDICNKLELVTNGLSPKGVNKEVFSLIDSLIISDYICSDEFEYLWKKYSFHHGFHGELIFRRKDAWDDLFSELENSKIKTQEHWDKCFYRTYDVTLERGRIFSCSRIAKKNWDNQGLKINHELTLESISNYLLSSVPKDACFSCATVGNSSQIPVADQDSDIFDEIVRKAQNYIKGVI